MKRVIFKTEAMAKKDLIFSMQRALEFWDNFDYGLYTKILKEKKWK